jgi:hypothetical protein
MTAQVDYRSQFSIEVIREGLAKELNALKRQARAHPTPADLPWIDPGADDDYDAHHLPTDRTIPDDDHAKKPGSQGPMKVCIVGAGVAGLYIAMILEDLAIPGLTFDILEADSRTGGRIFTHHFSPTKHDYYDVGAMRFPVIPSMQRTFDLFNMLNIPQREYYLDGGPAVPKLFNDRFYREGVFDPFQVSQSGGGNVPNDVVDNWATLLEEAFGPYKAELAADFAKGFQKLMEVDLYSSEYLVSQTPRLLPVK